MRLEGDPGELYRAAAPVQYSYHRAPLALWGVLVHLVPYRLTLLVVRALAPEEDMLATHKIVLSIIVYPVCWALEGWLIDRIGGGR